MRFPFFSWRMRLLRGGLFSYLAAFYKYRMIEDYSQVFHYTAELEHNVNKETFEKCDPQMAATLKHSTALVKQAFHDVKFKGDVHVLIYSNPKEMKPYSPLRADTRYFYNREKQPSARVVITHYPNQISDHNSFYRQIYAVGSHEAMHALHKHEISVPATAGFVLGLSPITGAILCSLYGFHKLSEMDADLSAAWKTGTAKELQDALKAADRYIKIRKKENTINEDVYLTEKDDFHPEISRRINYLGLFNKIYPQTPKLLQTKLWQDIQQERNKFSNHKY